MSLKIQHLFKLPSLLFALDHVILYKFDKAKSIPWNNDIQILQANHTNIKDVIHFQDKKYITIFEKFINEKSIGYLAYLNGKCVHRSWLIFPPEAATLHRGLVLPMENNDIFIHYCETASQERGKQIYPTVLNKIAEDYCKTKNIYISTKRNNYPSRKSIEKAGFKETMRYTILYILGIKFVF